MVNLDFKQRYLYAAKDMQCTYNELKSPVKIASDMLFIILILLRLAYFRRTYKLK